MIVSMLSWIVAASAPAQVTVDRQEIAVEISPETGSITVLSDLAVEGHGRLRFDLNPQAGIESIRVDGKVVEPLRVSGDVGGGLIEIEVPPNASLVRIWYDAEFVEDVASGERPGQIHNFAVQAHVGESGVFLSDGSAWHPRPLDGDGRPQLHRIRVEIEPLPGWSLVASGEPIGHGPLDLPCWQWRTPRPVDGLAIVGNRHRLAGLVHETAEGPVEIVMQVPEEHAALVPMFLEAAGAYLDLYVPRLGAFPYRRFSIVENFFSSGFAFPGFTVLGPQVVGMAPRSLAPGYLDHELLHCWWGNGVYVDPADGNWCEALTSFGANYFRRVADDGPVAGADYRRGILMKLSTDPAGLDDGPLGAFGSADPSTPGPDRFVGYDKGAFVFAMLADVVGAASGAEDPNQVLWACLRRFAEEQVGRRAGWAELQLALEASAPSRGEGWLDGFMRYWVREHHVPETIVPGPGDAVAKFTAQLPQVQQPLVTVLRHADELRCEIDPGFRIYRALPAWQMVPTIAGTTGPGGVRVVAPADRPETEALLAQIPTDPEGENLLLVGQEAVGEHAGLIARASDPIGWGPGWFDVGGHRYEGAEQALLHTVAHPDRPGRFVTVFLSNGDAGWSRLRLIRFYSRDTTVVWNGDEVLDRRVFEPDRWIPIRTD